ncbi:sporulation initiation inhibitor Soj [Desulfosarcina ovata subsp. sediminis]|uniref:Sporulation initiation inhibitor Soj n=1 Tax=Desulfosarcina ovata subsp. sediminis TaxID=885957 RepID=A0A5K7ZCH6_9BACT|nr:AAA family ATPase [Desulfosarcina ovata]BBO79878.1 sporulation initiation inhibitor Soj [Desulfosarcina ovata subsp. sediminis]
MIIVCQQCRTRFHLNDDATPKSTFVARCSVCGHLFSAYRPVRTQAITFIDLEKIRQAEADDTVMAISNRKGGVAKTTTCLNLGASLALYGKKVLLVDFDAQANLSLCLGKRELPTFYDAQKAVNRPLDDFIVATAYPNVWLLPSGRNMVLLNKMYFGSRDFEFLLKDRLETLEAEFDFILIDTPPSIEFSTLNALTAARQVLIPCQCDYLSTHGVDQVLRLIALIRKKSNPLIQSRVLLTMLDRDTSVSQMILSKIKRLYQGQTFETLIEMDGQLKEAQILSMPAIHYSRKSPAAKQYIQLAREILAATDRAAVSAP